VLVEFVELGPDRLGVGVVELVEDGHGVLPAVAGRVGVTGGVTSVAKAGEREGFFVAVADLAVQVDCVSVAGEGLGVVAEVVMGVAEAVPGVGLTMTVAELPVQGEGLPAEAEGPPMIAELRVVPADRVECLGLPGPVAGRPVQLEGLSGVVDRLGGAALPVKHHGEDDVGVGLADVVAELARQVESLLEVGVGVAPIWVLPDETTYDQRIGAARFLVNGGMVLNLREVIAGGLAELLPVPQPAVAPADVLALRRHLGTDTQPRRHEPSNAAPDVR
jgi:hypothetical protein